MKQDHTTHAATIYVYDADGQLAVEVPAKTPTTGGTQFLTDDALGSTRLVTDVYGNTVQCNDYLPFGEDLTAGGRTCVSTVDAIPEKKFTGKERDAESGLDYFDARYFSSAQGRFSSPDWAVKATPVPYAKLDNPQSLNLYSYVLNSPLIHIDVDGHTIDDEKLKDNKDYQKWKANYLKHKGARAQWDTLDNNKDVTVHIGWDTKSTTSVTDGYVWNSKGDLTGVNVTLAKSTGNTDNHMDSSSGYVHGSTLNNDGAIRQAYVVAHEFAHVEYAETSAGRIAFGRMSKRVSI